MVSPYFSSSDSIERLSIRTQPIESFSGAHAVVTAIEDPLDIRDDGTWQSTTVSSVGGEGGTPTVFAGTWAVEVNDEYSESVGAFFVRTVTTRNDEPVDPAIIADDTL
ncbi:MAG: hypothetical protein ACJA1R_000828 [Flavobacteriales bacterium]|jgi:hypothetical protein